MRNFWIIVCTQWTTATLWLLPSAVVSHTSLKIMAGSILIYEPKVDFFLPPPKKKCLLKMSAWQWATKPSICRSISSRWRDVLCGKHFSSKEGSSSWEPNIFTDSLASTSLILSQSMRFHGKETAVTWALQERNSPSLSPLWMHQWMVESSWPLGHTDLVSNSDYCNLPAERPHASCLDFEPQKFHF